MLGVLPGGCDNFPNWINASGMIVGVADLPVIDPLTGVTEVHASNANDATLSVFPSGN